MLNVGMLVIEDPSGGAGQETSVKATRHCRVKSSLAILQCVLQEIWDIKI